MREVPSAVASTWTSLLVCSAVLPACYLTHGPDRGDEPGEAAFALHPQLARGSDHACVLLEEGSVYCWGSNVFGQLGRGTPSELNADPLPPARVEGLPPIRQISASSAQTCALDIHGRVHCWGLNEQGQLGVGLNAAPHGCGAAHSIAARNCSARPLQLPDLEDVVQVSAGGTHACALRADARVLCWGWIALDLRDLAQVAPDATAGMSLGSNAYSILGTPAVMQGVGAAKQIAVGSNSAGPGHTCSVLADGGLQCWGNRTFGQTGPVDEGLDARDPLPTERSRFTLDAKALQVAAGSIHSCAVTAGGGVFCWGSNTQQELGVDTGYRSCDDDDSACEPASIETWRIANPVRVIGIDDAVSVSIHGSLALNDDRQTCVLRRDSTVTCWHGGRREQVPGLSGVVELSGDCATVRDGSVLCWKPGAAPVLVPEVRLAYEAAGR